MTSNSEKDLFGNDTANTSAAEMASAELAALKSKKAATGNKKKGQMKRKKKKLKKQVSSGNAYIQATYNNTIVTLTDQEGNVLAGLKIRLSH